MKPKSQQINNKSSLGHTGGERGGSLGRPGDHFDSRTAQSSKDIGKLHRGPSPWEPNPSPCLRIVIEACFFINLESFQVPKFTFFPQLGLPIRGFYYNPKQWVACPRVAGPWVPRIPQGSAGFPGGAGPPDSPSLRRPVPRAKGESQICLWHSQLSKKLPSAF